MKIFIYYDRVNKHIGLPWALRVEEENGIASYPAQHVEIKSKSKTAFIENADENAQKYYIETFGKITWDGSIAIIEPSDTV